MIETLIWTLTSLLNMAVSANLLWLIAHRRAGAKGTVRIVANGYRDQEMLTQARAVIALIVGGIALHRMLEEAASWNWTVWSNATPLGIGFTYGLLFYVVSDAVGTLLRRYRWHQIERNG